MLGTAFQNSNCDGNGPHVPGEVRVLPYSNGNLILCRGCHQHEIAWRKERNQNLSAEAQYDLPAWESIEIYPVDPINA